MIGNLELWNKLSTTITDNIVGVVATIIIYVVTKIFLYLWNIALQKWRNLYEFKIAGDWMSYCRLPSGDLLEIWHYYLPKQQQFKLAFFSYAPDNSASKWSGAGTIRNNKLSAYYYRLNSESYESGVVAMEVKAQKLRGTYAQFDPNFPDETFYVSHPIYDYTQVRIKLSLKCRIKMFFGFPPFRTYAEAKDLFQKHSHNTSKDANNSINFLYDKAIQDDNKDITN
jgi:hypothetical protein